MLYLPTRADKAKHYAFLSAWLTPRRKLGEDSLANSAGVHYQSRPIACEAGEATWVAWRSFTRESRIIHTSLCVYGTATRLTWKACILMGAVIDRQSQRLRAAGCGTASAGREKSQDHQDRVLKQVSVVSLDTCGHGTMFEDERTKWMGHHSLLTRTVDPPWMVGPVHPYLHLGLEGSREWMTRFEPSCWSMDVSCQHLRHADLKTKSFQSLILVLKLPY